MPSLTEADTCRKYVLPKLYASGWSDDHINEERTFTDARMIRRKQKRERIRLPKVGWHDLRHTSATLLHQSEPLRVARAILGHSDMETTLGYTPVLPGSQREAMSRLENRLLLPNVPKSQVESERRNPELVGVSTS